MSKQTNYSNADVIEILKEVLAAMEVKEVNRFRIRAYQNAISSIEDLTTNVYDMWERDKLNEIDGVGATLTQHLDDLFKKGSVKDFDEVKKDLPDGMFSLIGIRGIGAKKAFKLASAFNLTNREKALEQVKTAAENHKIRELDGFSEKSESNILDAISSLKKTKQEKKRMLLIHAEEIAQRLIKHMKSLESVEEVEALGSLRRRESTVGDIDLAIATADGEGAIAHFLKFPEIGDVLANGESRAAVVLKNDVQVDIRVVEPDSFGSMLQYFTGSKQHNVLLRTYALENGYSLSEYGIKKKKGKEEREKFANEKSFYKKINLPLIPPELRQGRNEIELAIKGELPKLIELSNIKGEIHVHTTDSDGVNTLKEMVDTAKALNYEYLGIADHAPSVHSRGRYDVLGIIQQKRELIEQINSSEDSIRVLFGYEINILADGSVSMPDDLMAKLDYVIASIHGAFDQSKDQITQRLLNAINNPHVHVIGHPSGRLINERDPYQVDWDKVFSAAIKNGTILEINAQPSRLDLADDLVRDAKKDGLKLMINTDAHSTSDMHYMNYGIDVARRGFCEAKDIENTKSFDEFVKNLNVKK